MYVEVPSANSNGSITIVGSQKAYESDQTTPRRLQLNSEVTLAMDNDGASANFVATDVENVNGGYYIKLTSLSDFKFKSVSVTLTDESYPESTTPTITAPATASIRAQESGTEVTEGISVTGQNLTGNTLTATLSPAVDGLSVTLSSSTITAGAISTTATLHYTQTVNASGSTILTLSDGKTAKNVTVNYKALVVPTELVAISEATTFELKNTGEGLAEVKPDAYVVLADAGSEASFADKLAVKGVGSLNVTWRSDAIQAGYFKFKTTVPGTVTVKFSDTGGTVGGDRAHRYANVNGIRSDVSSNGSSGDGAQVTCSPIAVEAGEVVIKGEQYNSNNENYTDNQIRIFTITFTPAVTVTIASSGYSSLGSAYGLDFANATTSTENAAKLTAFAATESSETSVKLVSIDEAPAETGVILKGTADATYTIPVKANAAALTVTNLLHAAVNATHISANTSYILQGGKFHLVTEDSEVPAGKAYLVPGTSQARELTFFFDGETTGINVATEKKNTATGVYYNLAGQRVNQPTKGIYVVDGKKVIK